MIGHSEKSPDFVVGEYQARVSDTQPTVLLQVIDANDIMTCFYVSILVMRINHVGLHESCCD